MESRFRFLTPPAPCEFLPDRMRQMQYEFVRQLTRDEYAVRMMSGWRRFGHAMFRHACPGCRSCQSLRIPVDRFTPDRSQLRAWKLNRHDVELRIGEPSLTTEKQQLFDRFHDHQRLARGWPAVSGEETLSFADNPFPTEEWCYYLEGRLVAVGYVDALAAGLSAIYFYYDPDVRHRSLGTYNVLSVIDAARARQMPHAYLGYYVAGCRSLEYKARFRPNEVLDGSGMWTPLVC